jgi:cytoskeletal protein CcmA (bactofilin family)
MVIGPAGIITGDIQCKNADIEGKFEGTIQVAEILNVAQVYQGRSHGRKLSVEPGADFSASCIMKINEENLLITDGKETQQKQSNKWIALIIYPFKWG